MTTTAQPTSHDELAAQAASLNARDWDDVHAGIPASHPRNEVAGAGAAPAGVAAGGQGDGDGQGDGGQGDELYQPYLKEVPAELHPLVLESLRAQSGDFTRRFQESAAYKSQMEPYEQIEGFKDVPPEEMAELVQFRQILSDPEKLKEWVGQVGQHLGVTPEVDENTWAQIGEQNGWLEGEAGGGNGDESGVLDQVAAMLDERLGPVQEFVGQQQQSEQHRAAQEAAKEQEGQFEGRFAELAEQHGLVPEGTEPAKAAEIKNAVTSLAFAHLSDDDPIGKAVEQYLQITGGAQGDLIESKLGGQTGVALSGGKPANGAETASWNGGGPSPKDLALARMRA